VSRFIKQNSSDEYNVYPKLWDTLLKDFDIKSVIDIGCGKALALKYFKERGCDIEGVEFWKPSIEESPVKEFITHHDYEIASYSPNKIYDLAWCHEFVEHVDGEFVNNFIETFKKSKMIIMSHAVPNQPGINHVNCQTDEYWIDLMTKNGFSYDDLISKKLREIAKQEKDFNYFSPSGLVFFNNLKEVE